LNLISNYNGYKYRIFEKQRTRCSQKNAIYFIKERNNFERWKCSWGHPEIKLISLTAQNFGKDINIPAVFTHNEHQ
jgi:hypothetical protein